jgi:hypothetical protein
MTQTLQALQVILFCIPILALLVIGVVILHRSVSIVDRRWFMAVLVPLLIANLLTIFTGIGQVNPNWRTWLMLGANAILLIGLLWVTHGFQIYGLPVETVEQVLTHFLQQQGFTVDKRSAEKRDLWGRTRDARRLLAEKDELTHVFWVTQHFNEVLVRAERKTDSRILQQSLPTLREVQIPYDFKAHAVGVLFIIVALVFTVLTWIFFFEPRFILIE